MRNVIPKSSFHAVMGRELKRAEDAGGLLSILVVDLDHFKSINDAFGHARGDEILEEFIRRIHGVLRGSDLVIRYGGDEFVLVLPGSAKAHAHAVAERLVDVIGSTPFRGDPPVSTSVSIGLASSPDDGTDGDTLFQSADLRLLEAKRRGRAQVIVTDPAGDRHSPRYGITRMIGRDQALSRLYGFLDQLAVSGTGVLRVVGPAGSGRSRILAEVGKAGRLRGYEFIQLKARRGLKSRPRAALHEAWGMKLGIEPFHTTLAKWTEERGKPGLILAVDDVEELDHATIELIGEALESAMPTVFGVVTSSTVELSGKRQLFKSDLSDTIELEALCLEDVNVWLRAALEWEIPASFLDWFIEQTGGLPRFVEQGLSCLVERGVLLREARGWRLAQGFIDTPLRTWLSNQATRPPSNLPAPPTSFIGRDREVQQVKAVLEQGRLVTIIGPGGIGKTRLGVQAATEIADRFSSGTYFVPLANLTSAGFLVSAVCASLQISLRAGERDIDQLLGRIRDEELLLVLDNFEHLIEGAEIVAELLRTAHMLRIIITSRERLNILGESLVTLDGLPFPALGDRQHPSDFDSVRLFVQGARRVNKSFPKEDADWPMAAAICQLVRGVPLALELASAWLRVLTCEEVIREIRGSIDFLSTDGRDIPDRHRSIRAVFDGSWAMLTEKEQHALSIVSVFNGGFRREAAAVVAEASLRSLTGLVDKSFLAVAPTGRYQIHELLRQLAEERLRGDAAEYERVLDDHCDYYAEFLKTRQAELGGSRAKNALDAISEEIENIRKAWQRAVEARAYDPLSRLFTGLGHFYDVRGWFREGEELFGAAADALRRAFGNDGATSAQRVMLGRLIAAQGVFLCRLGSYDDAKTQLERSVEIFERHDALDELSFSLINLGFVAHATSSFDAARRQYQACLEITRRVGHRRREAVCLCNLAGVMNSLGRFDEAERFAEESIAIYHDLDNLWQTAGPLLYLSRVHVAHGDYDEAKRLGQEAMKVSSEMKDQRLSSLIHNALGVTETLLGNYTDAEGAIQKALALAQRCDDREQEMMCLNSLGENALSIGDYEASSAHAQESLRIAEYLGSKQGIVSALLVLAENDRNRGDMTEAELKYKRALTIGMTIGTLPMVLDALVGLAPIVAQSGDVEHALGILAVAQRDPAATKRAVETAHVLFAEITSQLDPVELDSIQESIASLKLEEVAQALTSPHTL